MCTTKQQLITTQQLHGHVWIVRTYDSLRVTIGDQLARPERGPVGYDSATVCRQLIVLHLVLAEVYVQRVIVKNLAGVLEVTPIFC